MRNQRRLPSFASAALPADLESASGAEIPQHYAHPGLSMMQVSAILRSHWKMTLGIAFAISLLAAGLIKELPKTYTATATLIVNVENKDPLAGQQGPVDALGSYVSTQLELMLSPVILLPVVDRLDLTHDREMAAGVTVANHEARRDAVEKNLMAHVEVGMGRGGQLLYLSVSSINPVHAATIANAITDSYLEQERRRINNPAGERAGRYSEQLSELRDKVTAAQDKVTEFRQKNGITDLTAVNTSTEVQALDTLEAHLLDAQNHRRALESKESGEGSTTDEAMASASVQKLRAQLTTEESELVQLSGTFGPQHPKVIQLRAEMAETRRALQSELGTLSGNTSTELSRAKELEAKYTSAVAQQRAQVLRLRTLQDEGAKLMLELESAQAVYKRALDGYDQIMFASVGNYTNVSVISEATPPVTSSKPNKAKLFLMGIVAGLALGVGIPFVYELLINRRLRCVDDIEREFRIPVLAQFAAVPLLRNAT